MVLNIRSKPEQDSRVLVCLSGFACERVFCVCLCVCLVLPVNVCSVCVCAFVSPFPAYKITLCDVLFTCSGVPPVVEYYAGTGGAQNDFLEHVHPKNRLPHFSGILSGMPHEETPSNTLDAKFLNLYVHTRCTQP